jgi:hypothetical protein
MFIKDPNRIIVLGDTHGNYLWLSSQLLLMRDAVLDEDPLIVLSVGDFGFWPGSSFTKRIAILAEKLGIQIWVTPGNHEDPAQYGSQLYASSSPTVDARHVIALIRGTRWQWHDKLWLSVGGAVSPDRNHRIEAVSWWPEEELQPREVDLIIAAGPADVLVTHDVSSLVDLKLPPWPRGWGEETERACLVHRELMQRLADGIMPRWWYHGHYHLSGQQAETLPHGRVEVTSLNMDGQFRNWGVLDTRSMEIQRWNDVVREDDWNKVIENWKR